MKKMKTGHRLTILLLLIFFSLQTKANNPKDLYYKSKMNTSNLQQEINYTAYVLGANNSWIRGGITIVNGYVTKCQFPQRSGLIAKIYQKERPLQLNPNNAMAVKNNFTHYIDIPNYGRAYFSM